MSHGFKYRHRYILESISNKIAGSILIIITCLTALTLSRSRMKEVEVFFKKKAWVTDQSVYALSVGKHLKYLLHDYTEFAYQPYNLHNHEPEVVPVRTLLL